MFSRLSTRVVSRVATSSKLSFSTTPFARPSLSPSVLRPSTSSLLARSFSSEGPEIDGRLTVKNVEIRILDIFRTFDKVNQDNVSTHTRSRGEKAEKGETDMG